MEAVEVTAVNQCSGNSRGFFQPRVNGGQLAHGAMGNAKWRGVRLKDVLAKAGIAAGAKQVVCNGLDAGALPTTPDFIKALEVAHALDGEVLIAWSMNDEDLPWLNGYPLRLIVPGYYGTYWIKHLNSLEVVDDTVPPPPMLGMSMLWNVAVVPGAAAPATMTLEAGLPGGVTG